MAVLGPLSSLLFSTGHLLVFSGRDCSPGERREETDNLGASQVWWQNRKHTLCRRREERILNVNGDGCDRKKIAGRRIRRELKIRESEKLEDDNHNNSPCN